MSINWMTLLAQIANFLILVWLLKRFLYQPVRRMIAEREKIMTEHIRKGELMQEEARERERLYESKIREFEAQREQMLRDVREEAEELRRRLHDEAIQKANQERVLLLDELQQEKQQFDQSLREQILGQACAMAGQVVRDLTHRRLESVLIDVLAEQITVPDSSHVSEAVTVKTSFAPTEDEKQRLKSLAIRLTADPEVEVNFEVDSTLIFGIELISTSEAVSWSARDYLNSLQDIALDRLIHGRPVGRTGVVAGD